MEIASATIIDVIVEGLSMRVTRESGYTSFLLPNDSDLNILIRALQNQNAASETGVHTQI